MVAAAARAVSLIVLVQGCAIAGAAHVEQILAGIGTVTTHRHVTHGMSGGLGLLWRMKMVALESHRPVPVMAAGVTLGSVIVEAFGRYPRREAFVQGDRRLTYAQCSEIVGRLMSVYVSHGVAPGSGVAMLSPNRAESWLAQAAAYLLGCSFTGLQLLGGTDDHVFICDDAAARLLIVDESCADRGREIRELRARCRPFSCWARTAAASSGAMSHRWGCRPAEPVKRTWPGCSTPVARPDGRRG